MLPHQTQLFSSFLSYFLLIIIISFTSFCSSSATIPSSWNHSDRSALLAFKSDIVGDPLGVLDSWNESLHHCEWHGIICSRRHPDRVTTLNLTSLQLHGTLSPRIGNLSFLRQIDLSSNFFRGGIPSSLTRCSQLKLLNLNFNNLTGNILSELSSLSQLERLGLFSNNLVGSIPSSFGNLSSLRRLVLGTNRLEGRIPSNLCHIQNLEAFHVAGNHLEGEVPSCLYNLSNLFYFSVAENQLEGNIPPNIGHTLPRIQTFNLRSNKFSGLVPLTSLCDATRLETIDVSYNSFSGEIQTNVTHCSNLKYFEFRQNMFSGNIPPSLGNLSSLVNLILGRNNLEGSIPDDLCRITTLTFFELAVNKLTGQVPSCVYNLSNMERFSVTDNQLNGNIPPNIAFTLPKIQVFFVAINKFTGYLPSSLLNATTLERFDFGHNQFTGPMPRSLGRLKGLRDALFRNNSLGTQVGNDLEFITSLSNCTSLKRLIISDNILKAPLPDSLSNLSSTIIYLDFGHNRIYGNIPLGIEKLINIEMFYLARNDLKGSIPLVIGKLSKLGELTLGENKLSGEIPTSFGNLTQLTLLLLEDNEISGTIPSSLGNCQKLEALDLSQNRLVGKIPNQLTSLSLLTLGLDLHNNFLTGPLPLHIGNLNRLTILDVSKNKLSSHIPESIGNCLSLVNLSLANNSFEGEIPKSLNTLKGLQYLDLSNNNFFGDFPEYLDQFSLIYLNLSFNKLQGLVPKNGVFANASAVSIVGNKDLCGGITKLNLPPCIPKKKKSSFSIWLIASPIVGILILLVSLYFMIKYFQQKKLMIKPSGDRLFNQPYNKISYSELFKATNGFSTKNLIGLGSYGSVFKGVIQEINQIVAVKVLNLRRDGASNSFLRECNSLRNLRHRNLVKIITSCSSMDFQGNDFKALVFEFMSNGSLNEWLHPRVEDQNNDSKNLSFVQRIKIAIDVAYALEYLHHQQIPTIVHCDLKPSNILLDDDMIAHVADFGLAKIFATTPNDYAESGASSILIKGSIGYVAPEYGMGSKVSTEGDVYSYGILLLEMFTGKKPTDDISLRGINLHNYSRTTLPDQVMEIIDPMLVDLGNEGVLDLVDKCKTRNKLHECLALVIKLGVQCSFESPIERLTMVEVVNELHHIKDHYQGVREFQVSCDPSL